jgi:hypothetical protein
VIALVGDGAMQMNNMAELITVQKYWKRWRDPRWIVCVFNNQDLNEVTWEQRVMEGNPKFDASQEIPDFAYARFGEMLGFKGIFVDSPDRLASAWQEAIASDRPVVIEVKTDPEVVPLPPHLTLKQARGFIGHDDPPSRWSLLWVVFGRRSRGRGGKHTRAVDGRVVAHYDSRHANRDVDVSPCGLGIGTRQVRGIHQGLGDFALHSR